MSNGDNDESRPASTGHLADLRKGTFAGSLDSLSQRTFVGKDTTGGIPCTTHGAQASSARRPPPADLPGGAPTSAPPTPPPSSPAKK